jgi:hypothetical protein
LVVLGWLRVEFGIEKPNQKLQSVIALGANELVDEVKKCAVKIFILHRRNSTSKR